MATDKKADRQDLDALTREFLERGGAVKKCEPGPSEFVTYRNGPRRFKKAAPKVETQAAPKTELPEESA